MNYWLDLFAGTSWEEFKQAGANVSGFRPWMRKSAPRVDVARKFHLSPSRIHLIEKRDAADKSMAERRAKVRGKSGPTTTWRSFGR